MGEWLLVLAGAGLTVGTAVFVAAEFSLVALDRPTVQQAVEAGDARARPVLASLRRLSTQLSAAQVGITVTTLLVGYLAQPSVGALLGRLLSRWWAPDTAAAVGVGCALVLVTIASMVLGELLPQFLGISAPLATAKVVAVPVRVFGALARPLVVLFNGSANVVLRSIGVTPREELSGARTPQELASLVRRSATAGTIEQETARRLTRSLGFGDRTASDVMTPRVRASAVPWTATAADVVVLARRTGHSRFPVLGEGWDDIRGVVQVKAAVSVPPDRRADTPVSALLTGHVLVPETMRLDPLLRELRAAPLHLVVVVDEYGGTSGLATLEDAVEELVGEVVDEHDPTGAVGRRLSDGSWSVPGTWRVDETRERVGAPVPDGPAYETLGGLVMAALGRVPVSGDRVPLPGWVLVVSRMEGRRVARLRVVPDGTGRVAPGADPGAPPAAGHGDDTAGTQDTGRAR